MNAPYLMDNIRPTLNKWWPPLKKFIGCPRKEYDATRELQDHPEYRIGIIIEDMEWMFVGAFWNMPVCPNQVVRARNHLFYEIDEVNKIPTYGTCSACF